MSKRNFLTAAPTATPAQAFPASPNRVGLLVVNNGTQTVYLGKDATVTTATGLPLYVNGTLGEGGNLAPAVDKITEALFAVTASGTGDLRAVEYVLP